MLFFALALACASVSVAFGQSSTADRYVISAKAGGVNDVEGTVTVQRQSGTSGLLLRRDRLEIGDRVTTGNDGMAEVLMNPGSYIRLGSGSSFEFRSTDLEDLQIKIDGGSAMFEVFASNEFRVSIVLPKGSASLVESGIYRVDVAGDGSAVLSVTKGKAEVGGAATVVKEGKTATIADGTVALGKFDKDKLDSLGQWSRLRSKELGKVTASLQNKHLGNTLLNAYNRGAWNIYDSFGLWIFDASFGGYCFLPFGNNWRSPYGWWYRNGIYWNNLPGVYIPPIRQVPTWATDRGPRSPVSPASPGYDVKNPPVRAAADPNSSVRSPRITKESFGPPPFTRVNRESGSDMLRGGNRDYSSSDSFFQNSSPRTYTPMSAPPPMPAPVTPPHAASRKDN